MRTHCHKACPITWRRGFSPFPPFVARHARRTPTDVNQPRRHTVRSVISHSPNIGHPTLPRDVFIRRGIKMNILPAATCVLGSSLLSPSAMLLEIALEYVHPDIGHPALNQRRAYAPVIIREIRRGESSYSSSRDTRALRDIFGVGVAE